jgi:hypothetical protein
MHVTTGMICSTDTLVSMDFIVPTLTKLTVHTFLWTSPAPSLTQTGKETWKAPVKINLLRKQSTSVTEFIFMKFKLAQQLLLKSSSNEFHEHLKNSLFTETRSRTDDRHGPKIRHSTDTVNNTKNVTGK